MHCDSDCDPPAFMVTLHLSYQGDPIHGSRPQTTVPTAPNCRAAPLHMDKASLCDARTLT